MAATVPSPYNFVPVGKYVYLPDWADIVSQDVPFEDGLCGWLDLEIKAETPLLVGGETRSRSNEVAEKHFVKIGGTFAMPGTTVKGMLRAVVEIASYGKLKPVNDHRFSLRDLNDESNYRNYLTETLRQDGRRSYKSRVKAGWLTIGEKDGEPVWTIAPCEYGRVEFSALKNYAESMGKNLRFEPTRKRPGHEKYSDWERAGLHLRLSARLNAPAVHNHSQPLYYREVTDLGTGPDKGQLVFTGQTGQRTHPKHLEFFFADAPSGPAFEMSTRDVEDFKFIHRAGQERHEREYKANDERRKMNEFLEHDKRAPVFYLEENGKLRAVGLAMMFKLAQRHSVREILKALKSWHLDEEHPDLAELIFGHVFEGGALRGRVSIEYARLQEPAVLASRAEVVLGAPKASYVPNYLVQPDPKSGWKTYMQGDAALRGWKRYPVRDRETQQYIGRNVKDTVRSMLCPLGAGTQFHTRLHFHNLLPAELGAVLWAIDFGQRTNCFHSVGMGRPLGFGRVHLSILKSSLVPNDKDRSKSLEDCRKAFVDLMEKDQPGWEKGEALAQLLAMANPANAKGREKDLEYPVLDDTQRRNDFADFKKRDQERRLEPYVRFEGPPDVVRLQEAYNRIIARLAHPAIRTDASTPVSSPAQTQASASRATASGKAIDVEEIRHETWEDAVLTYDAGGGGRLIIGRKGSPAKVVVSVSEAKNWFEALPKVLRDRVVLKRRDAKVIAVVSRRGGVAPPFLVSLKPSQAS